jgi:hypothetical protein
MWPRQLSTCPGLERLDEWLPILCKVAPPGQKADPAPIPLQPRGLVMRTLNRGRSEISGHGLPPMERLVPPVVNGGIEQVELRGSARGP